jgi:hypothetical protein
MWNLVLHAKLNSLEVDARELIELFLDEFGRTAEDSLAFSVVERTIDTTIGLNGAFNHAAHISERAMSNSTKSASPPASRIVATVCRPPPVAMSATTTAAPSRAKAIAAARPMPEAAPVTIATLSFNASHIFLPIY